MPLLPVTDTLLKFLDAEPLPPPEIQDLMREIEEDKRSLEFRSFNDTISREEVHEEIQKIVGKKLELDRRCAEWFKTHS